MLPLHSKLLVASVILAGCAAGAVPPADPSPPPPAATTEPAPVTSAEPSAEPSAAAPTPPAPEREPTGATPMSDADMPPPGSPAARWMREHFSQTVAIRNAVVSGHLERAVNPAAELTQMAGVDGMPKQWKISGDQLRDAANRMREAGNIQDAAAATADIGRACGHCHSTSGRGPKITVSEPPPAETSTLSRMKRHKWGAERLWEGIYGPSEAAWVAGSKALENDPFDAKLLEPGGVHARSAASDFRRFAKELPNAKTNEARGRAFAQLTSTCAPCHEAMGVHR
jgi:hypothetical protein